MKFCSLMIALAITLGFLRTDAAANEITRIMTEVYPPYNMLDFAGQPVGVSVDLLHEIFREAGDMPAAEIEVLPWSRGYAAVQTTPGAMLFSTTRTAAREDKFKWVGPIARTNVALITKGGKTVDDLAALTIGVIRDDVAHQTLVGMGVPDSALSFEPNVSALVRKLAADRLDAIGYESNVTRYAMRRSGISTLDFVDARILLWGDIYYAFHPEFDQDRLADLQLALDRLRVRGVVEEITRRYLR